MIACPPRPPRPRPPKTQSLPALQRAADAVDATEPLMVLNPAVLFKEQPRLRQNLENYFLRQSSPIVSPTGIVYEKNVLEELYLKTNGVNWFNNTNWCSIYKPKHKWYGVTVNSAHHVTELDLSFNNLKGEIPASLSKLLYLTSLKLNCNQLTGTIPQVLARLKNLKVLTLDHNQLTGGDLESFKALKHFTIQWNHTSG